MSGPIPHAVMRVCQRIGIKEPRAAEEFLDKAFDYGIPSEQFDSCAPLRNYLKAKCREGNKVYVYKGIVVVYGAFRKAITAYPLPTPLLRIYRKEMEK